MIQVGASVQPLGITSPVPMSGFAARTRPSTGEHDELGARALALDEIVLITIDVCALEESTCRTVAQGVRPDAPEQVIVTATHTHSGPASTPTRLTHSTPEVEQQIMEAAITAGTVARAVRRPCAVEYREARGVGVASNRRHADREVDPPVQLLRFTAADSTPGAGDPALPTGGSSDSGGERVAEVVASLLTYPCHPVVLDGTNRLLSGDYVHPLRARIEAEHPGSVAVFATGCAGDLNTGHSAEASYSLTASSTRTFAEAERVGTWIADAVLTGETAPVNSTVSTVVTVPIALDVDRPRPDQLAADIAAWTRDLRSAAPGQAALLGIWLDWADALPAGADWTGRVSAFRLGSVTVVTLPGEPFLDVADQIRAQIDGPCLVLGYADGCPGYLPTAGEYPHGGYEVEDAHRYYGMPGPFAAGSAEILIEKAVEACRALG